MSDLREKVDRYRELLDLALKDVEASPLSGSHLERVAVDFLSMARSYYEDGVHFIDKEDLVNALACFSYGHAWLDAGARLGVFNIKEDRLFAI